MTVALPATRADRGPRRAIGAPGTQLGLMVCDRRGRVLAANGRLREIVSPRGAVWDRDARCCTVLGCGHSAGPLEGGCLTVSSLAAGEPLEDVPIRPGRGKSPLLVTATPLCDAGSQVLFEVRPDCGVSDTAPLLHIFALGAMQVEGPAGPLVGDWLAQRPGELLRFLVCERWRIVPADVIGEAIWPHAGAAAPNTVRHFVHALRDRLEPGRSRSACASTVVCRRGGYGLDPNLVWVDVDEFEHHAVAGMAALHDGRRQAAREHLESAIAFYRGDFLADDPYAEWALRERDRLRGVASEVLRVLVDLVTVAERARYLEQLAELEPFDDDVHRDLVAAWLLTGRRSRAARHYESFRVRLMRAFGEPPGFELCDLIHTLEAQRSA
jgi:DNA-binding SARP family transcriptional activator